MSSSVFSVAKRSRAPLVVAPVKEVRSEDTTTDKIRQFKNGYRGVSNFLGWAANLSSDKNSLFAQQRRVLGQHTGAFAIPNFVASASRFSDEISSVRQAKNIGAVKAAEKTAVTSLYLANSGISLLQHLDREQYIDLSKVSAALPFGLSAFYSVSGLALKSNGIFHQTMGLLGPQKPVDPSVAILGERAAPPGKIWKVLNLTRSLCGFTGSILSALGLFFGIYFAVYWLLTLSTIMLVVTLINAVRDCLRKPPTKFI